MPYNPNLHHKQTHDEITFDLLGYRANRASENGYPKAKWIEFCETLLSEGFYLTLYEARETVSKYITVHGGGQTFVVRFSNHPPSVWREKNKDCDFFVGKTNFEVTTTEQALRAVRKFFGE